MAKVEDALREVVRYQSRRVAKEALGKMPAQLRAARREIRALQKAVGKLVGDVKLLLEARRRERPVPPAPEEQLQKVRFTRRAPRSLRARFDLTQEQLAKLLEVSPVTITSWESGKARPRSGNLAQIVALRHLGQAEVDAALGRQAAPAAIKPPQMKRLRKRLALTQAELAGLLGVSTASVTSWEAGKAKPGRESRHAIAELRKLSPGQVDDRLGRAREGAPRTAPKARGLVSPAELKAIRKQAGLSQRDLAKRLKVSINSVSNWETGRTSPRASSVGKLLSLRKQR